MIIFLTLSQVLNFILHNIGIFNKHMNALKFKFILYLTDIFFLRNKVN